MMKVCIIVFVVKMRMVMFGLESTVKLLRQTFVRMIRNGIFLEEDGFAPMVVFVKTMLGTFDLCLSLPLLVSTY